MNSFIHFSEISRVFDEVVNQAELKKDIEEYKKYKDSLLFVPYVTVSDYLYLLLYFSSDFSEFLNISI